MNLFQRMALGMAAAQDDTPPAEGCLILLAKLDGYEAVWRRLRFPARYTLYQLHLAMQAVTLFNNSHLFQFSDNAQNLYVDKPLYDTGFDLFAPGRGSKFLAAKTPAGSVLRKRGAKIRYVYDMGDSWTFTIKAEKATPIPEGEAPIITCLAGEKSGPVEDCGGVYGYLNILKALAKPEPDDDDRQLLEWLGEHDPEHFDLEKANRGLARIKAPRPARSDGREALRRG